jgi:hypothetical protein
MASLTLKRASASRPSGQWQDEDYDVLADGKKSAAHTRMPGLRLVEHLDRGGDVVYRHAHKLKLGSKALITEMSAHLC